MMDCCSWAAELAALQKGALPCAVTRRPKRLAMWIGNAANVMPVTHGEARALAIGPRLLCTRAPIGAWPAAAPP